MQLFQAYRQPFSTIFFFNNNVEVQNVKIKKLIKNKIET